MNALELALTSELSAWGNLGATTEEAEARIDVAEQALAGYVGRLEACAATLNEQGRARLVMARQMLAEVRR